MRDFDAVRRMSLDWRVDELIKGTDCSRDTLRESRRPRRISVPVVRASDFYREMGKYVDDGTWESLRESIVDMMDLEDRIMSEDYHLREGDEQVRLLEDYDRILSFERPMVALRERGYDDLTDEEKELYDRYRDRVGNSNIRKKDSYKQRLAKMRKLDRERDEGRGLLSRAEEIRDEVPETVVEKINDRLEHAEIEAQESTPVERKKILGGVANMFKKIRDKYGDSAVGKFMREHPKLARAIKGIATHGLTIGAGVLAGATRYAPLFTPVLGPIAGPAVGVVTGIAVAYVTKAAGMAGGKLGGMLGKKLSAFINKKAATSRIPILKGILQKLATPAGNKCVELFLTIGFAIGAGGLAAKGADAIVRSYGPQLAQAFKEMLDRAPEVQQTIAVVEEGGQAAAEEVVQQMAQEAPPEVKTEAVAEAQPQGQPQTQAQPQQVNAEPASPQVQQARTEAVQPQAQAQAQAEIADPRASIQTQPPTAPGMEPSALDATLGPKGWERIDAFDGHPAWKQTMTDGSQRIFVDYGGDGVMSQGDILYTKMPDGTFITEQINASGEFQEISRQAGQTVAQNAASQPAARQGMQTTQLGGDIASASQRIPETGVVVDTGEAINHMRNGGLQVQMGESTYVQFNPDGTAQVLGQGLDHQGRNMGQLIRDARAVVAKA